MNTVKDLDTLFGMILAFLGIVSIVLGALIKYKSWPYVKNYIDERTSQIQPDANGGKSLPDIAFMLGELKGQIGTLLYRIEIIEKNTEKKSRNR